MLFYSHIVFADLIKKRIKITNTNDYYFGSVFPDIRYYLKMPRTFTHLGSDEILDYITEYPDQKNFLAGYYFHCVLDEMDVPSFVSDKFLSKLLKNVVTPKVKTVLLEYYFKENVTGFNPLNYLENNITKEFDIKPEALKHYSSMLNEYMNTDSLQVIVATLEKMGLTKFGSVEKYLSAAEFLEHHDHTRHMLFKALDLDKLNDLVLSKLEKNKSFDKLFATGIIKQV
ncbi:MAG: hypothetical protein SCALA702_23960 [Melioribacteraceae bacterium]|nr:MAG: hypothetical protein SCALA702_23960 [Melioribacteraceae bacterium]